MLILLCLFSNELDSFSSFPLRHSFSCTASSSWSMRSIASQRGKLSAETGLYQSVRMAIVSISSPSKTPTNGIFADLSTSSRRLRFYSFRSSVVTKNFLLRCSTPSPCARRFLLFLQRRESGFFRSAQKALMRFPLFSSAEFVWGRVIFCTSRASVFY